MLQAFFEKYDIQPQKIAVAVSGGADSLDAVIQTFEELSGKGYTIIALTVDHGLRPSSYDEACYVKKIMDSFQIEHHILLWQGLKPQTGVEEAARLARYELLNQWCKENNVKYLVTAHHLYDEAETFLMHLERGSGLNGLCGMKEVTKFKDIFILRPFLETNPDEFKKDLNARHISWVEDESNQDENLCRVKMRHFLPILEEKTGISPSKIVKAMKNLQATRLFFEKTIQKILKNNFKIFNQKIYCCSRRFLTSLDVEIQYRLLGHIIQQISLFPYPCESEKMMNLISKISQNNFKSATLGHVRIIFEHDFLWFGPEEKMPENYSKKCWNDFIKSRPDFKKLKIPGPFRPYFLKLNDYL